MAAAVSMGQFVVAEEKLIIEPIVEEEVCKKLKKPEGEFAEAIWKKSLPLTWAEPKSPRGHQEYGQVKAARYALIVQYQNHRREP